MEETMHFSNVMFLNGFSILISILLLIVLFILLAHQKKNVRQIAQLKNDLEHISKSQEFYASRQHEDLLQNLQQLNESLLAAAGQMNRSQAEQVNAVIRQSFENTQAYEQRQMALQRMIDESMQRSEMRIEAFRKSIDENMRLMREENAKKLSEMQATVDEKLNETLEKRLSSSFSQVSERLEQVYRSLGEVHSLASGVGDLKRMLSNVKTRGVWGEIQLGALLEQALTNSQYDTNVAVVPGSPERVEFAVRLPGRDSKFVSHIVKRRLSLQHTEVSGQRIVALFSCYAVNFTGVNMFEATAINIIPQQAIQSRDAVLYKSRIRIGINTQGTQRYDHLGN